VKLLMLVVIVVGVVFVGRNKERLYLRDPVAKVERDGVAQRDVWVMINYTNDVLLQDQSGGRTRVYLVQAWNKTPGLPPELKCLYGLTCMTDADHATATPIAAGARGKRPAFAGVTMTDTRVEFVDESGALVSVKLR
jgi:hypothetical protein